VTSLHAGPTKQAAKAFNILLQSPPSKSVTGAASSPEADELHQPGTSAHRTPSPDTARSIIVILGAHRSGTSLAAQLLSLMGMRVGDDLIPGRSDNPQGFWEHAGIIEHTRAMEEKLGLNPFRGGALLPPDTPWWRDEGFAAELKALEAIIRAEVSQAGCFGFKDPRTTILLPMWQELFANLNLMPRYVLALRSPAAVAASMSKRRIPASLGEAIWLTQMAATIKALKAPPQAVVSYDRWFVDPAGQARDLAAALELPVLGDDALRAALDHAVDGKLRHHASDAGALSLPLTGEFYEALLRLPSDRHAFRETQAIAEKILESAPLISALSADLMKEPLELRAQLTEEKSRARESLARERELAPVISAYPADSIAPRHSAPYAESFPSLNSIAAVPGRTARPLKVCIATEDIVGPIRNGGIGTTYTHLAFLLADAGHDVTILYLRGEHSEGESIDRWVDWYAERKVRFVPVEMPEHAHAEAARWLRPMFALYEALKKKHYDLVHVSEWRGSAYYALLAKRQGLAFHDTLFCVKTSSPWLWNREYGLAPITDASDLTKIYAERRSVELADIVIGGSRHLLGWMLEHGYKLPEGRTFVQPNVTIPVELPPGLEENRPVAGTRVPINEFVFFGRLEARKGLDVFCEAVHLLMAQGVTLPKITFMGKVGTRIPGHLDMTIKDYIAAQAQGWATEWQILDTFDQAEALTYLHGPGRLAVMPSQIENSSLAVYETTHHRIPFLASNRGGNPELVAEDHQAEVLVEPHPVPLSERLRETLERGGFVAAPSFDNDTNLGIWRNFHANVSTIIHAAREEQERADKRVQAKAPAAEPPSEK
jgi:glycosyltransferase involved in cell wall biosynthesis